MARKTWAGVAEERRQYPGIPRLVTKPEPSTSLNFPLLHKLQELAEREGLQTELRPLHEGRRPLGLWVWIKEEKNS